MIGRLGALIFFCTVYLIQTEEIPHQISFTVVDGGENVTLRCPFFEKEGKFFRWYKLPLGYMVQTVATGTYNQQKLSEQFNNPRFKVTEREAHYALTITNVSKDDEATYFCQTGTAYSQRFVDTVYLAVNDHTDRNQQKCVNVKQSPEIARVQPGDSTALQCSLFSRNKENSVQCPGEHSVYWFRAGSGQSLPGIIYTNKNLTDKQEKESCVYTFSKTVRDSSDTGIYYCAVFTCGEILFGQGTEVETRPELDPVILVLGLLLACCVTLIAILIFCKNQGRVCRDCKAGTTHASHHPGHEKWTVHQSTDLDNDAEGVNYAALNFSTRKVKRAKRKKELQQECIYSAVSADYHT